MVLTKALQESDELISIGKMREERVTYDERGWASQWLNDKRRKLLRVSRPHDL
jgi:hypothetical protein